MAATHADLAREARCVAAIHIAMRDESESLLNDLGRVRIDYRVHSPVRPAPQTWPKACRLGCPRRRILNSIGRQWPPAAVRTTVDAGCEHGVDRRGFHLGENHVAIL